MTNNTESFGRWRIVDSILSDTAVPFTLRVSKVPVQENQFITINPDTTSEEIFYYTTKTGTIGEAWSVEITGRGYNVNNEVQDLGNQRQHDENAEYKLALNHIIINRKADLDDSKFTWEFRVPVFTDAAERDSIILVPEDGMLCYLEDVEDFSSYKNGIWINGLGWGWSATYYQDSTSDGTLVGAIDGVNTTYTLSNAPASPTAVVVMYNGVVQELGATDDYTIVGTTITFNFAPDTGKVTAIYPDTPVGSWNSQTREIPASASITWELFRNTDDSSNLYYKDESGDLTKIHDDATDRIDVPQATESVLGVVNKATDAEVLAWVEDTKYITSKWAELVYWVNHTWTLTFTRSGTGTTILPVPAWSKIAYVYKKDNNTSLNEASLNWLLVDWVINNVVIQEWSNSEERITWNGWNAEYYQWWAWTKTIRVYFFSSL